MAHDGSHGDECFGCKIKTISVSPYATPSRLNFKNEPKKPNPAWERGVPTDSRGMPFLGKDLKPIGIKQYSENRTAIEAHRRRLHNSNPESRP